MTAQDLKNSILQLAVQGKLVPQDPNDEPASELLKRIDTEKNVALKAGIIKKDKKIPLLTGEDIPYDVPNTWCWMRLGELCQLLDGEKCSGVKYPYLEAKYLRGKIAATFLDSGKFVKEGTRLILVDGENSGEVFFATEDGYMGSTFKVLYMPNSVYEPYILNFLLLKKQLFRNSKTGAAIPHLNKELFFTLPVPIPPYAEQERIVAKIEELLPLVDDYGEAEECLKVLNAEFPDKLRKSILQQAVQGNLTERDPADEPASELLKRIRAEKAKLIAEGKIKKEKPLSPITDEEKPFDIPDTWEWVRLGELGETQTGTTPSTKNPAFFGNDIPFIKPADIYADHINYENEGLSFAGSEQGRIISKNSIMMVCIGGSIGKTYYNDRSVCCNQQINTITPIFCSVKYVWLAMSSNYFRCELQKEATGTATPIINKSLWSNIVIPLPPLAEQERIVARGEELLAVCDGLKYSLRRKEY